MNLLKYPCSVCLVKAVCNSFECSILEKFLTTYYNSILNLTSEDIKIYRETAPSNLKKAMNFFNENREVKNSIVFLLFVKDDVYKLTRTINNTVTIKRFDRI